MANEYDPYFMAQNGQTVDPHAAYMSSIGTAATGAPAASGNYTGLVGAGVGAAATAATTIANIMAASQARQQGLQSAALDRDTDKNLVKMRLAAAAQMADKERAQQATSYLLQSLGARSNNALRSWDTGRQANQQGASLIQQVFG